MGKSFTVLIISIASAFTLHAQTLTATNGVIQRGKSVIFSTSRAFFPHKLAPADTHFAPLEQNQFSVSLRTDFKLPTSSSSTYGSETYRYQLRLLNSANAAITLSGGRTSIITSEFIMNSTSYREVQLKEFPSKTQNFTVVPSVPLPISSTQSTISIALQRKTNDTTVWQNEGAAVTLALQQEISQPQLRVLSASPTEIRLAYNYSTNLGAEVFSRWKLDASTTLAPNSFSEITGVTPIPVDQSPGVYQYTLPINSTAEPIKFFRLRN